MLDFLGKKIKPMDFVAYPGSGNTSAEYGLILYKVLEVYDDSIRVERLTINYQKSVIIRKPSVIKACTKVVCITPPPRMVEVFNSPDKHFDLVGTWVHGRTEIDWDTLKISKMRD